jgi:aminopeptidase N
MVRIQYLLICLLTLCWSGPLVAAVQPSSQSIDVKHYDLALDIDAASPQFQGTIDITFVATQFPLKRAWFHAGENLTIQEATLDGTTVPFTQRKGRVTVRVPKADRKALQHAVSFRYSGIASDRNQEGLFRIQQPDRLPAFYTQLEPVAARLLFPCHDEPFDKATTAVTLRADRRYTLLSNGEQVDARTLDESRREVRFLNEDPISTYHLSVVAAELERVDGHYRSAQRSIPLTIYVSPGHRGDVGVAMHALRESMAFFEDYFGQPYPWKHYGIVAVEGFTWGGMENKGLANINAHYLYWNTDRPYQQQANIVHLIAHELAHEWFGNLVTMSWWHDLWLNEAFATFMEKKVTAHVFGEDFANIRNHTWLAESYFPQDQGPLSHPIVITRADTVDELFDSITYTKGVQVVRMLEAYVGEANFQRAIQSYMGRYRLGNASTTDFLQEIAQVSGVPLEAFAAAWLHRKGYPRVEIATAAQAGAGELVLTVTQTDARGRRLRHPFPGVLQVGVASGKDQVAIHDLPLVRAVERFVVPIAGKTTTLSINRDGRFLAQYVVGDERTHLSTLLSGQEPGIAKVAAVSRALASDMAVADLAPVIQSGLEDDSLSVRLGIVDALLRERKSTKWIQGLARQLEPTLLRQIRINPKDPIAGELQQGALTLLGEANDPDLYGLLHARLGHRVVDVRMGALAGLLRTNEATRFASFREMIRRERSDPSARLELLRVLARTPDIAMLPHLVGFLTDTALIAKDDSSTPRRVLWTLGAENWRTIYTPDGVDAMFTLIENNLDRPGVATSALRAFQGISHAPSAVQSLTRKRLQALRSKKPPPLIDSIVKKLL